MVPKRSLARVAIAALAAALLLAACSNGESGDMPTTSITAGPSPTSSATPALGLPSFALAPPVALPPGIALLLETGCFQCDGPATGLIRVSRSAAGVSKRDLLLSAGAHQLYGETSTKSLFFAGSLPIPRETVTTSKDQHQYEPYVTGIAASPDGREIVVSVCVYPGCGVGMDAWSADGRVALYRSTDSGATWSDFGSMKGGALLGVLGPGEVLAYSPVGPDGPPDVFLFPGNQPVPRVPSTEGVFHPPLVLADGTVAWRNWGGSLERPDGSVILRLPEFASVFGPFSIGEVIQQPFGDHLISVEWTAWSLPGPGNFLSLFAADGSHLRTLILNRPLHGGVWASDTALIANVQVDAGELPKPPPAFYPGLLPALIDIQAGTISPIVFPFLEEGAEMGRNYVRGVQHLEVTP